MIKKGFTLVEILVAIAIVAIVGLMLGAIFINTLRGSNKSQILSSIKQNGQQVLEEMDKTVRGASDVICVGNASNPGPTLVIVKNEESGESIYVRYRIYPATASDNGYIARDYPLQPEDAGIEDFMDTVCSTAQVSPSIMTDTNPQTGVSVEGYFSQDSLVGFNSVVGINFSISPGVKAPVAVAGQIDPVEFVTTIGLR